MLNEVTPHTTIAASDIDRARQFYAETLGFEIESDNPGGIFFKSGVTHFLVFPTAAAGGSDHTVMGSAVGDIEAEVAALKDRGVSFLEYDVPGLKTENSIAQTGPIRAAWFRDSEGNILGVVQLPGS